MIEGDTQLTAFTFSAVYLFIPSLPVTHALGLVAHLPKAAKLRHLLLYPFKGGKNHTIFQIISWVSSFLCAGGIYYTIKVLCPRGQCENAMHALLLPCFFMSLFLILTMDVIFVFFATLLALAAASLRPVKKKS